MQEKFNNKLEESERKESQQQTEQSSRLMSCDIRHLRIFPIRSAEEEFLSTQASSGDSPRQASAPQV